MSDPSALDLAAVEVLLCDADGNLFASEEPAFVASAEVTNRLMRELGADRRFTATELRLSTTGRNFRTTAVDLARAQGLAPLLTAEALEGWVLEERRRVTAHLREALAPDPSVTGPLTALSQRFGLAAVSSSASSRLDACFTATGLADLFPPARRFSAEDSLPRPTSKPDPAIYAFACRALGISPGQALAIEDAVPGAQASIAAGIPTIGNVAFVPARERRDRTAALRQAGVAAVIASWQELADLLGQSTWG